MILRSVFRSEYWKNGSQYPSVK